MKTIVNERELGFADIVSEGLKIFFFKFKDIALIALIAFIPINILIAFIAEGLPTLGAETNSLRIILWVLLVFLEGFISIIVSISIAIITEKVVDHKNIAAIDAVKSALSIWGSAITTGLLAYIIILGLSLLFIVPGIIYSIYYIFVLPAVALRDKAGKEALDYSKKLVQGQWWRIFGILLGLAIIFGIFSGIITYALSRVSDNPYYAIIPNTITYLIGIIASVISVVLFLNNDYVYHRRLKKRAETERSRKTKKAPPFEQFIQKLEKDEVKPSRRSTGKRTARKSAKKTISTKRNSRNKN